MRKLIFAINTPLDGRVDHTKQFVAAEGAVLEKSVPVDLAWSLFALAK